MVASAYISEQGKNNLAQYKYSGSDHSLISPFLQPFWNYAVELLPISMAPNLVTLVGFFGLLLAYGLTAYYAMDMEGEIPPWVYLVNIAALFWYQTLDAIDGKQARRTNSSSPLGELFDHGCDAIGSMLQTMVVAMVLQLGTTWWPFVLLTIINFSFFASIWEQYYTHVLHFHILAGPTEGECVVMLINLIAFLFGSEFWRINLSTYLPKNELFDKYFSTMPWIGYEYEIRYVVVLAVFFSTIPALYSNIKNVYTAIQSPNQELQAVERIKMEDRYRNLPPWRSMITFLSFVCFFAVYLLYSPQDVLKTHTFLVCSTFGLVAAYLVSRLVLARVCDEQASSFYVINLPLPLFALYSVVHELATLDLSEYVFNEAYIMMGYLCFVIVLHAHFIYDMMSTISNHLQIYCFTLGKRTEKDEISALIEVTTTTDEKQN